MSDKSQREVVLDELLSLTELAIKEVDFEKLKAVNARLFAELNQMSEAFDAMIRVYSMKGNNEPSIPTNVVDAMKCVSLSVKCVSLSALELARAVAVSVTRKSQ